MAYGPQYVYRLAQRPLNQGGGATRASTNADSYARLTNSLYFYDATGYFPRPPKFRDIADIDNISAEDEDRARDIFPVYLGEFQGEASDEEVQKRFQAELDGMRTAPPTNTNPPADLCKSDNDCSSPLCAGGGVVYSCIQALANADPLSRRRRHLLTLLPPAQGVMRTFQRPSARATMSVQLE